MPGYISEVAYEGGASANFIEIVVPRGTDTSAYTIVIYDTDGTVLSTMSLGAVDVTLAHNDGYVLDETDAGFVDIRDNHAIALVDDTGTVLQFLGFKTAITATEGPANGQTSAITGDISSGGHSVQTADGGATYTDTASPNPGTIPCYAPGTLIATPDGPRRVETLQVGDLVETLDHGAMPIRWVRQGDQSLDGVGDDGKPIMIRKGAFAPGRPARDLVVSPQHRILVGGLGQLDGILGMQAFASAKSLTGLPHIRVMKGATSITWIHFALATHEVVWANNCLSESLLLGPMVVQGLTRTQKRAVTKLFGASAKGEALNGPAARDCLRVGDLRRTLNRLSRDDRMATMAA